MAGSRSSDEGCIFWLVAAFLFSCAVLGWKAGTAISQGHFPTIKVEVAPGG